MLELPNTVKVVLVTKGHSVPEIIAALHQYQLHCIGESRWQEANAKLALLPRAVEKHFIGHLQGNKVMDVVGAFDCIETVDSLKLAYAINNASLRHQKIMPVLLQVNVSNDPAKYGFRPSEVIDAIDFCKQYSQIAVMGLMAITAKQPSDATRLDFKLLKQLQVICKLPELSMGMSDDWEMAVAEGASIVRIGRALFADV